MSAFTESVVEDTALAWLESLGYAIKHGPDISPVGDTLTLAPLPKGRENYSEVVLGQRLREVLVRLNPTLSPEAIDDVFRKVTRLEGATLDLGIGCFIGCWLTALRWNSGSPLPVREGKLFAAVSAKNALAQMQGNMQKMHIAFTPPADGLI
ncbi:MAG: hypothetical protein ACREQ2_26505 [Candidatus Binatia bacterium]